MSKPTTLYRLFDTTGELLYVGIAGNPGRRFDEHAKDKLWWSEVRKLYMPSFHARSSVTEEAP